LLTRQGKWPQLQNFLFGARAVTVPAPSIASDCPQPATLKLQPFIARKVRCRSPQLGSTPRS
ncbi:MAG: hypothetical protein AAFY11_15040, partial [Cyanobacteria bacterium J06641_5]